MKGSYNLRSFIEPELISFLVLYNFSRVFRIYTAIIQYNGNNYEENCTFSLLIDDHMFEHISCTELEASRVLGKKWTLAKTKLKAFIEIWYARRVYEKKKI